MAEDECPSCGNDLLIRPMNALHAGLTPCDLCNTAVLWRSEAGTQTFNIVKVIESDNTQETTEE